MAVRPQPGPARSGTKALIAGVMLLLTGAISIAALVVQLASYDPRCEPVAAWDFVGACGVLRLLVLLMLPVLLAGIGLLVGGLVLRRPHRRGASPQRR
jgi:hypothetical protein